MIVMGGNVAESKCDSIVALQSNKLVVHSYRILYLDHRLVVYNLYFYLNVRTRDPKKVGKISKFGTNFRNVS